jgi:uncharacterized protein YgfB (UPF0149 family)
MKMYMERMCAFYIINMTKKKKAKMTTGRASTPAEMKTVLNNVFCASYWIDIEDQQFLEAVVKITRDVKQKVPAVPKDLTNHLATTLASFRAKLVDITEDYRIGRNDKEFRDMEFAEIKNSGPPATFNEFHQLYNTAIGDLVDLSNAAEDEKKARMEKAAELTRLEAAAVVRMLSWNSHLRCHVQEEAKLTTAKEKVEDVLSQLNNGKGALEVYTLEPEVLKSAVTLLSAGADCDGVFHFPLLVLTAVCFHSFAVEGHTTERPEAQRGGAQGGGDECGVAGGRGEEDAFGGGGGRTRGGGRCSARSHGLGAFSEGGADT